MNSKHLFAWLLAILFTLGAVAQDNAKNITVTGKLTRVMAIGGESTGWAVQFDNQTMLEGKPEGSIEVRFKDPKLADKYENKRVSVTGILTHRHGVETGDVAVLEISLIKSAKPPKPATGVRVGGSDRATSYCVVW